jgi:hypothetical protein
VVANHVDIQSNKEVQVQVHLLLCVQNRLGAQIIYSGRESLFRRATYALDVTSNDFFSLRATQLIRSDGLKWDLMEEVAGTNESKKKMRNDFHRFV